MVTPKATDGKLTMVAWPDHVRSGEFVHIELTIAGPFELSSSCQAPNPQVWVLSPTGRRIPLTRPSICQSGGTQDIGEGETVARGYSWETSSGLAPGLYSIHGKLSG